MNYDIQIITNDLQTSILASQNLDVQSLIYNGRVSREKSLKLAVLAYKKASGTDPYKIGVSVLHGKWDYIVIHSKNGTGIFTCSSDGNNQGMSLSDISEIVITEYTTGIKKISLPGVFDAYSDPIYTDLVYGSAVMHTNIDDNQILFKDFALFSDGFSVRKHEEAEKILGYSPIIEFSAINKRGMEMDFLTYKSKIDKFDKYGYFVMKTPLVKEKIEIL